MGFYQERVVPILVDLSMRQRRLADYRRRVVPAAAGRVLEIGIGSGLNLSLYGPQVQDVVGVEPSERLADMAKEAARAANAPLTLLRASAESIPVEDSSIDTVVTTWTLCSIPAAERALAEMRRVLKPDGQLLFAEHGLAPEQSVQKWQHRLTPVWKKSDYWGVASFFAGVNLGGKQGISDDSKPGARPEFLDAVARARLTTPTFLHGKAAPVPSGVPARRVFAEWLTSPENPFFARATVNRLWAHFFGRGFVNPIDDLRDDNPASHPEPVQRRANSS